MAGEQWNQTIKWGGSRLKGHGRGATRGTPGSRLPARHYRPKQYVYTSMIDWCLTALSAQ